MNALVKKEIRLVFPAWVMATLLAMIQGTMRPYDFYVVALLFLGMTMMALSSIGRETSLNTFSFMLAQPVERMRVWQVKLSVLSVAFLIVFGVWLAAFFISNRADLDADAAENSYNLFITVCLVTTSTFTGGLWATLLLRQLAGAFWLTLLVPATLSGVTAGFLAETQSNNGVIAALCVILGIYSLGGFLFARWLFFRAQDVGWSGGIIALPEWKIFSAQSKNTGSIRTRRPVFALVKKEFQLQHVSLMGAAGLLVLHIGVIVVKTNHRFAKDSAGEILTSVFWVLWLVLPVMVGAMSVAEECRLGVMEGQLCLPASRRMQFAIKCLLTLFLGVFLGGALPCLLETIGNGSGAWRPGIGDHGGMLVVIAALSIWLSLVSFFASSLAKNFLQAVGFAIATFTVCTVAIPAFANIRASFFHSLPMGAILPLFIAVPTLLVTLLWLAYLNYKNFRDGWHLWRRSLLVVAGAILFVTVSSTAIYNRAWEMFKPAEPAHGMAKLSLVNPPTLQLVGYDNLLVRLPDGRVWFDYFVNDNGDYDYVGNLFNWRYIYQTLLHPLPESGGPQRFIAGSNWVAATTARVYFGNHTLPSGKHVNSFGYFDTVGIQPDGTLWVSGKPEQNKWTADTMQPFGTETNWRQLAQSRTSVVLLKNDGTLWRWGFETNEWTDWAHQWPGLRAFKPHQIGTNSDWSELFTPGFIFAVKTDGKVWYVGWNWKTGKNELGRETNLDEVVSQTASRMGDERVAFVRKDGTLWVLNRYWNKKGRQMEGTGVLQVGQENNWTAVAVTGAMMVALKADGSLWQWDLSGIGTQDEYWGRPIIRAVNHSPTRLGIHDDWVALAGNYFGVIALAADGSLWLWPDKTYYEYGLLISLPKQPQFLGNVFNQAD